MCQNLFINPSSTINIIVCVCEGNSERRGEGKMMSTKQENVYFDNE